MSHNCRIIILLWINFIFIYNCNSQIFFGTKLSFDRFARIDLSNCSVINMPDPRLPGYCSGSIGFARGALYNGGASFTKNGPMAVAFNGQLFGSCLIHLMDTITYCNSVLSQTLNPFYLNDGEKLVSLNTDDCNRLWTTSNMNRLLSVDLNNNNQLIDHGFTPYKFVNATYRDGALYGMWQNAIYRINVNDPKQCTFEFSFSNNLPYQNDSLVAIESIEVDCGVWETYLFSEQYGHPTIPKGISKLDFSTGQITLICNPDTSYFYMIAAVPKNLNCKFSADLDQDNSSGAIGNDFNSSYCPQNKISIVDIDPYLSVKSIFIDSIIISLKGIKDYGVESLMSDPCNYFKIVKQNDSTIILTELFGTESQIIDCLKNIVYLNKERCPTDGNREVQFTFSTCDGNNYYAQTKINIPKFSCAGENDSIKICNDGKSVNLNNFLSMEFGFQ